MLLEVVQSIEHLISFRTSWYSAAINIVLLLAVQCAKVPEPIMLKAELLAAELTVIEFLGANRTVLRE
jgi:hypothetical protein